MKALLFTLAILFAAVGLTLFALDNPGYVLIAREPWSVEMPLTLFAGLLLALVGLLYLGAHLLLRLMNIPRDVSRWRQLRRQRRSQESLTQGLLGLLEGNWVDAEKQLLADLRYAPAPAVNYLAAACAAQGEEDREKRADYLSRAHKAAPDHELAVSMAKAQLHYLSHEYEQALATISQVRIHSPSHPPALRLLALVYRELADWTALINLMPELRKRKALPAGQIDALEQQAHRELLTLSLPSGSLPVLEKAWQLVPKPLRQQPEFIAIYARQLLKQNEMGRCEALLRETLANGWDEELVYLFGRARSANAAAQLALAETWLDQAGHNPVLLLTLGRLAAAAKQPAKAREYLSKCVAIADTPEAYAELADLAEQEGDVSQALAYYRRGCNINGGKGGEQAKKSRIGQRNGLALDR